MESCIAGNDVIAYQDDEHRRPSCMSETSDDSLRASLALREVSTDSGVGDGSDETRSRRQATGVRRIDVAAATPKEVTPSFAHSAEPDTIRCTWRPMKPGYATNVGTAQLLIEQTVEVEKDGDNEGDDVDSSFRLAIPVMSRSVAIFCAVCNVIAPGLGTFASGLSICCGSRVRIMHMKKMHVIMLNTWVAVLQLTTTPFFLVGWIWSIVWSSNFISISKKHALEEENANEDAAIGHHHQAVRRTTTTTTVSVPTVPQQAPIIVLREAPVSSQMPYEASVAPLSSSHRRHRHSRRHSTASTTHLLPEVLLAPGALETILIHNGSASSSSSSRRGSANRLQASTYSAHMGRRLSTTSHN